jgi:hypothetical protein
MEVMKRFLGTFMWAALVVAGLIAVLGYLWHPLWLVARVLFLGWLVVFVAGWLWLLGWWVVDTGSRFFKRGSQTMSEEPKKGREGTYDLVEGLADLVDAIREAGAAGPEAGSAGPPDSKLRWEEMPEDDPTFSRGPMFVTKHPQPAGPVSAEEDAVHPYIAQFMADEEAQAEVEEGFLKPLRKARRWARLRGVRTKKIDRR